MDALYWNPHWQAAPTDIFRERIQNTLNKSENKWVIAGNYTRMRDLSWPSAQAIVWLDYSFYRLFCQLTRRTFLRWWRGELLWGTNHESFFRHFKLWSKDSLYYWLVKTYPIKRREYTHLLQLPENQHLKVYRFHTLEQTQAWLQSFADANNIDGDHTQQTTADASPNKT
eukprot:TRINITY_DN6072_c0_g1_i1.p1 TRINITY_DN6072_c0_g1~~TRINITY_DN6072_c0_g1_i1.p1  ORF type:complete len:177 (-),score=22.82 TRINITY_DN6072_c0_g1_i1:62-571(-)